MAKYRNWGGRRDGEDFAAQKEYVSTSAWWVTSSQVSPSVVGCAKVTM